MHRNHRHAFTLIELLIVVTVIAVLIGLLLPAIAMVRRSAQKAECASNQRQLYMGLVGFADENHGRMPLVYNHPHRQSTYFFYNSYFNTLGGGMLLESEVMDTPKAFFCPANRHDKFQLGTYMNEWPPKPADKAYMGYALRPMTAKQGNTGELKGPLPFLENVNRLAIIADVLDYAYRVPQCHEDGLNVTYGDGHVDWVHFKAFKEHYAGVPSGPHNDAANASIMAIWETFDTQNQ